MVRLNVVEFSISPPAAVYAMHVCSCAVLPHTPRAAAAKSSLFAAATPEVAASCVGWGNNGTCWPKSQVLKVENFLFSKVNGIFQHFVGLSDLHFLLS